MQESEALSLRLKALVRKNGGNAAVSEKTGIKLSTLNTYLAGVEPKLLVAARLAEHFGVPISALLYDDHEIQEVERSDRADELVHIPLRDVFAAAGAGSEITEEPKSGFLSFSRSFVAEWGRAHTKVEAIRARGDSMEPTIMDGSVVLIDRAERTLIDGRVFAFRTPDGLRLKRFQRAMDGSVLLVSDNRSLYAPERISSADLEQLRVAGRAFWTERLI